MKIRILDILEETMADGPGLRTSIYCAGCAHHCPGCHNPQSWDFQGGREVSVDDLLEIVKTDEFADVTFSGGDPLYQVEAFTELARRIKEETGKNIWCYTGFTYEEIMEDEQPKIDDDAVKELPEVQAAIKEHEENQKKNADSDETSKKDEGSEENKNE